MHNLTINSQVKNIFRTKGVPMEDGLSYLVMLYYGLNPTYIPSDLERKVLSCGIVTKDYETGLIVWKVSLFEEQEDGFEWISDWMDSFKRVNPERRGTKAYVLKRMKQFFVNNPAVRKDDVIEATNKYLSTVSNPTYCKKSHKFIYEADGSSMLGDYVEQIKNSRNNNSYLKHLI